MARNPVVREEENPFLEWVERRKWPVFLGATAIASLVAWFMKRRGLALGITAGSFLVIGFAFLAFPLTVWAIHGWVVGSVSQLGLNPYLAEAIALAIAVGLYFVFSTFVFDFDSRKHKIGMALVWSLAIGFFLAMYLKTRDTPYVMENGKVKAIGGITVDPATGKLRVHETIGMVTGDGSISRPVTSIDSIVVEQQIELKQHLTEHNEFKPEFLLDPENLTKVPWVHYETGAFLCSYCAGLDGEVRLYLGPGRCSDGKLREPANGIIQEMLERRARKHQETLDHEAAAVQGRAVSVPSATTPEASVQAPAEPTPAEGATAPATPEPTKPTTVESNGNMCVEGMKALGFTEADAKQGCGF